MCQRYTMTKPGSSPSLMAILWRWGEMIKFSHSVFALPFALLATFLAGRAAFRAGEAAHIHPGAGQLLLIVICMVCGRAVAMTFNRIADAALDARNPRTTGRAIPAGLISKGQAAAFLAAAAGIFILACAGFWWRYDNLIPIICSGPVLAYLCLYSYTKRFTPWSHLVLGGALALSPVGAWLAIHPASLGRPALIMMAAVICWVAGFDVIYACQDVAFDRRAGLFSLPGRLGPAAALWIARGAHLLTVILLAALIPLAELGWLYGAGVAGVALLLLIENALVRPDDFSRANAAFFTVNGIISVLLGAAGITDCLLELGLR